MNIFLTGATGYIGKRLLPRLVKEGHFVYCAVRDLQRFKIPEVLASRVKAIQVDLLDDEWYKDFDIEVDVAYYLVHSMSRNENYYTFEARCAMNFRLAMEKYGVDQVVYLSGIANEDELSKHLSSRRNVERILHEGLYHNTTFRAGIIIGSGSASFEIIRDLAEKLPIMITPKWLKTRCQPIGIRDVLDYLLLAAGNEKVFDQVFDIGGKDILTYKEMLLGFAKSRNLKRWIFTVPVMTPKLSSYWLYFVTSTSYSLAKALVSSMKVEVVCKEGDIQAFIPMEVLSYSEALDMANQRIQNADILSTWKDAFISGDLEMNLSDFIEVPKFGCFKDKTIMKYKDKAASIENIWAIGGDTGWYHAQWLWNLRGLLDKFAGGVGLQRGRTHPVTISEGDSIDFWRVIYANKEEGRLLLIAEMKLPGEAWLEFKFVDDCFLLEATYRPRGIVGRLYWYLVVPFHGYIFKGLSKAIVGVK